MSEELPTYAVIIEWENARLSELGRTREMLKQLHEQIIEVAYPRPEIIILHDKDHVDRQLVEEVVGEVAELKEWPADIRVIPTEGLDYYAQKNFGAQQSDSDLILFLDSDVIPEQGWLAGLLEAFQNPDVQAVCGSVYVDLEGFYNKAFALFWLFPLPVADNGLHPLSRLKDGQGQGSRLVANNIAFRREIFEAFQYPTLPTFRGSCAALKNTLAANGIDTFLQTGSRVSHPPPNGLRHFVNRAVCQGHDTVMRGRRPVRLVMRGHPPYHNERTASPPTSSEWHWRRPRRSLKRYRRNLRRSLKPYTRDLRRSQRWYGEKLRLLKENVLQRYQDVGLSPVSAVGALGIGACYYTVAFGGALLAILRPELVRRHFSV